MEDHTENREEDRTADHTEDQAEDTDRHPLRLHTDRRRLHRRPMEDTDRHHRLADITEGALLLLPLLGLSARELSAVWLLRKL